MMLALYPKRITIVNKDLYIKNYNLIHIGEKQHAAS